MRVLGVEPAVRMSNRRVASTTWRLYLVTDDAFAGPDLAQRCAAAIAGGVTAVQLRLKHATTRELMRHGEALRRITADARVPLLVDDRVDVALALDADGAHVGQSDLPPAAARALLGERRILGLTVDLRVPATVAEALDPAVRADYIGTNAIFATGTKDTHAVGLAGLARTMDLLATAGQAPSAAPCAAVAIGGIHRANATDVAATPGVDGVAVVSAILGAADPAEAARELRLALDAAGGRTGGDR